MRYVDDLSKAMLEEQKRRRCKMHAKILIDIPETCRQCIFFHSAGSNSICRYGKLLKTEYIIGWYENTDPKPKWCPLQSREEE